MFYCFVKGFFWKVEASRARSVGYVSCRITFPVISNHEGNGATPRSAPGHRSDLSFFFKLSNTQWWSLVCLMATWSKELPETAAGVSTRHSRESTSGSDPLSFPVSLDGKPAKRGELLKVGPQPSVIHLCPPSCEVKMILGEAFCFYLFFGLVLFKCFSIIWLFKNVSLKYTSDSLRVKKTCCR